MENRSIFNIPAQISGKLVIKHYKSPQSSPDSSTFRLRRTNSIASEVPLVVKSKHKSRNSVDYTLNTNFNTNKPVPNQNIKIKHMTELLQTVRKSSNGINSMIKEKMIENRILAESINNVRDAFNDDRGKAEEMKHLIEEEKLQIGILKGKVLKMTQFNELRVHKVQLEEIQSVIKQNEELRMQIEIMKNQRKKYGKPKISKIKYEEAKSQLHKLELKHESNLTENLSLQHSLLSQKKQNDHFPSTQNPASIQVLKSVLSDLLKFSHITSHYIKYQSVDLSKLLIQDFSVPCSTIPEYLEKIRKTVESLRIQSTDLYAEHCGSNCITQ